MFTFGPIIRKITYLVSTRIIIFLIGISTVKYFIAITMLLSCTTAVKIPRYFINGNSKKRN